MFIELLAVSIEVILKDKYQMYISVHDTLFDKTKTTFFNDTQLLIIRVDIFK